MTSRRDILIGGACIAASVTAFGLTPRRRSSLLGSRNLDALTPIAFGRWVSRDVSDLVAPKVPGSLVDRLYNQTVERVYLDPDTGAEIMVLLAHGDTQSAALQLHRPEVCYPAFGFEIASDQRGTINLAVGASLPVREIVAVAPGRQENVVYWTRLGQYLPASETEQRLARMKAEVRGEIADGLLARFSMIGEPPSAAWSQIGGFVVDLLRAVQPSARSAFIGSHLAMDMATGIHP